MKTRLTAFPAALNAWIRHSYFLNKIARNQADLEEMEKMFAARKNQLLEKQDNLVCKLWEASRQARPITRMWANYFEDKSSKKTPYKSPSANSAQNNSTYLQSSAREAFDRESA